MGLREKDDDLSCIAALSQVDSEIECEVVSFFVENCFCIFSYVFR